MYKSLLKPGGIIGYHDIESITEFLNSINQEKLEKYHKEPPYSDIGAKNSPGVAIYYVD